MFYLLLVSFYNFAAEASAYFTYILHIIGQSVQYKFSSCINTPVMILCHYSLMFDSCLMLTYILIVLTANEGHFRHDLRKCKVKNEKKKKKRKKRKLKKHSCSCTLHLFLRTLALSSGKFIVITTFKSISSVRGEVCN